MKLQTKYFLFISILHLTTLVLSFVIFSENKVLFIASELLVIISLLLSWSIYKQLLRPLKTIITGIEAIRSKDFNTKFLPTGTYEMDQLIDVYNDMADQLQMERISQEQQHFFLEKLIFTSPTGILVLDHDGRVDQANPRMLALLNMKPESVRGKNLHEIPHPVTREISDWAVGLPLTVSINGVQTFKVQKAHFIDRGFARHFIMAEELTAELLAAEKKVYEKVIRMMAHEVNNTIGPVNSILSSALNMQTIWESESHVHLRDALQVAIERNNNLNSFMRSFAELVKLPAPVFSLFNMNLLIQRIVTLFAEPARLQQITIHTHLDPKGMFIKADEQQMEQVLINILKNAIEAIDTSGDIMVTTNSDDASISVTDTGKGIDMLQNEQLFSPFFSTKKNGQGIGLTLVREILLNHSFRFSLHTLADRQTEFRIDCNHR